MIIYNLGHENILITYNPTTWSQVGPVSSLLVEMSSLLSSPVVSRASQAVFPPAGAWQDPTLTVWISAPAPVQPGHMWGKTLHRSSNQPINTLLHHHYHGAPLRFPYLGSIFRARQSTVPADTMSEKRAAEGAPEVAEKKAKHEEEEEEDLAEEEDLDEEEENEGEEEEDDEGMWAVRSGLIWA